MKESVGDGAEILGVEPSASSIEGNIGAIIGFWDIVHLLKKGDPKYEGLQILRLPDGEHPWPLGPSRSLPLTNG